jgi:hypothetical protein
VTAIVSGLGWAIVGDRRSFAPRRTPVLRSRRPQRQGSLGARRSATGQV